MSDLNDESPNPDDAHDARPPWAEWLDAWRDELPRAARAEAGDESASEDGEPATEGEDDRTRAKRTLKGLGVVTAVAAVVILALGAMVWAALGSSGNDPAPVAAPPITPTTDSPPAAATSSAPLTPQCETREEGETLVTDSGGEVDSPQTLVAEFQHRYFDLRDGEAVAALWDDGYDAEGFQTTIDSTLKDVEGRVAWCLTVAPAESGWWATEVEWWEQGDKEPKETWFGTYEIKQRGSGFIFTDAATEEK